MAGARTSKPGGKRVAKTKQQAINRALIEARKRLKSGEMGAFEFIVGQVLAADPMNLDAMHLRSAVLIAKGQLTEAAQVLRNVVNLNPKHVDARVDLGDVLRRLGEYRDAEGHLRDALKLRSRHAGGWLNLGNVYLAWGRLTEAEEAYVASLKADPQLSEAAGNLSNVRLVAGKPEEAAHAARKAVKLNPRHAMHHSRLALALDRLGDESAAMDAHKQAMSLAPDSIPIKISAARSLAQFGRMDEALVTLRQILVDTPGQLSVYANIARFKKFSDPADPEIAEMRKIAQRPDLNDADGRLINFALGKALEECGAYDEAFTCFERGNRFARKHVQYAQRASAEMFEDVRTAFKAGLPQSLANTSQHAAPIFIVGMPRSGSSMVEQIIAQHPDVHGVGELAAFHDGVRSLLRTHNFANQTEMIAGIDPEKLADAANQYAQITRKLAGDERRVVDKLPSNFIHIGLIKLMFPDARIVHCAREPAEMALSIYKNNFSTGNVPYSFDLADIGHYVASYQKLMDHWQKVAPGAYLTVHYEKLVADQLGQSKRLFDWCGLDWRDEFLDFHKSKTPVHTASIAQVRQPIHSGSVGLAAKYGAAAEPLIEALRQAGVR